MACHEAAKGARPGEFTMLQLIVKNGFQNEDRKHRATAIRPSTERRTMTR